MSVLRRKRWVTGIWLPAALGALLAVSGGCDRIAPPRQPTATPAVSPTLAATPDPAVPNSMVVARDAGLQAFGEVAPTLAPPDDLAWVGRDTTPAGVVVVTSYEFASSGWTVSVVSLSLSSNLVAYELTLDHAQSGLHWAGRMNQALELTESNINVAPEVLVARQIALDYLLGHDPVHAPPSDLVWLGSRSAAGTVPGHEAYQFLARGWAMTVEYDLGTPNDVVYEMTLAELEKGFLWRGRVDAQGTVLEHR